MWQVHQHGRDGPREQSQRCVRRTRRGAQRQHRGLVTPFSKPVMAAVGELAKISNLDVAECGFGEL
jgi:hypothetical protein